MTIRQMTLLFACATALAAPAFAQDGPPEEVSQAVEAADTTGVLETLLGAGDVTVFVPTNDALAAAPQDVLGTVLGNEATLAAVIQGYAVEGKVMAADVMAAIEENGGTYEVTSLGGTPITLTMDGESVMVAGAGDTMATVVTPDVEFGTITVHVIDGAILPAPAEELPTE